MTAVSAVSLTSGSLAFLTALWEIRRLPEMRVRAYYAFYVLDYGFIAITMVAVQFPPAASSAFGASAAMHGWMWWKRRPPRKRRPSKVLATIRDLGHRLAVTS